MDNSVNYKNGSIVKTTDQPMAISPNLDSKSSKSIFFDSESKGIFIIILCSQLLFLNGYFLFGCFLTLYLIFYHLQQPLKSGVFTLIAFNHFLQIIAAIWQANSVDKDINFKAPNMSDAT